jgi:hypothetical protein
MRQGPNPSAPNEPSCRVEATFWQWFCLMSTQCLTAAFCGQAMTAQESAGGIAGAVASLAMALAIMWSTSAFVAWFYRRRTRAIWVLNAGMTGIAGAVADPSLLMRSTGTRRVSALGAAVLFWLSCFALWRQARMTPGQAPLTPPVYWPVMVIGIWGVLVVMIVIPWIALLLISSPL